MKPLLFFFISIFLFNGIKDVSSQIPTYDLYVKNIQIEDINQADDALSFDIYLRHTNSPTPFEYAGGQYCFNFNPEIADGGTLSYEIISSQLPVGLRPVNPAIVQTEGFPITLKLDLNSFPGPGNGYNLTNISFPGIKIATMRLINTKSFKFVYFYGYDINFNLEWRISPIEVFPTKVFAYVAGNLTDITSSNTYYVVDYFNFPGVVLHLRPVIEGLYNPSLNTLNRKDSVTAYLRNINPPYNIMFVSKAVIDSALLYGTFYFQAPSGTYYIQIEHLNSVETWGSVSLQKNEDIMQNMIAYNNTYDFSTSQSQAYGNNLKLIGTKYCIYSGDVNQDDFIDATDLLVIENEAYGMVTGNFLAADLNGDSIVDGSDLLIGDNNAAAFVGAVTPLNVTN